MVELNAATLAAGEIEAPGARYDRSALTPGIVHIGVGGFHRAHQAMTIERLLAAGEARDFAICGVGLLPGDAAMRDALHAQDCLYTLTAKHPDGTRDTTVIGAIVDYLFAPDDPEKVIEAIASPATKIVSLTVTEGGYNTNMKTGEFEFDSPSIRADLEPGAVPATWFGLVTAGLARRRERGLAPVTVLSCDNVAHNGRVTRAALLAFAGRLDPDLAAWIEREVSFPNCMVDRITPVTSDADRAELAQRTGIEDRWPVVAEPFFQWVVEDDFVAGRPPFELADVQIVEDVQPYELMKLRLLNAGHQSIAYFGTLLGHTYAHEAMRDARLEPFTRAYWAYEARPTLPDVPGIDLDDYCDTLVERFGNPEVRDTLARLAAYSSDRIPTWVVPPIRENIAAGRPVTLGAAIVASWARYAQGRDEQGNPIEVVDLDADYFTAAAASYRDDPLAFVRRPEYFADLAERPEFTEPYLAALESLNQRGAAATLAALALGSTVS